MNNEQSFEQKQTELEEIVAKLEAGNAPLSEMMELYERGAALYRECAELLDRYEKRLSELSGEKNDA